MQSERKIRDTDVLSSMNQECEYSAYERRRGGILDRLLLRSKPAVSGLCEIENRGLKNEFFRQRLTYESLSEAQSASVFDRNAAIPSSGSPVG